MKKILKTILIILFFCLLTIISQIGGIIFLAVELLFYRKMKYHNIKKYGVLLLVYLTISQFMIPFITPVFGREKIKDSVSIEAHSIFTKLFNRNYVRSELHSTLQTIASDLQKQHPDMKLIYLDANFPFMDGFPLLPHLSHSDGKKIDVSFIYKDDHNNLTNKKPSVSGYGVFEVPLKNEYDQPSNCIQNGHWQYDFTKYFTFGTINKRLKLSEKATKDLLLAILKQQEIGKVFIEPHLKERLRLKHPKIRYHGCQAVRHDDHIHLQLK